MPTPVTDPLARFWPKVDKTDGCWLWTGGKTQKGYGVFWFQNRQTLAHRAAYELLVGPIPDGLQIDHLCRNRACVNPGHMEPVPCRENLMRGVSGSAINAAKTHCKRGHEFTPDNIYWKRKNGRLGRNCATCHREQQNARRRAA